VLCVLEAGDVQKPMLLQTWDTLLGGMNTKL